MHIDPDGKECVILLKGNGMAMVQYPNGYICFWILGLLKKEREELFATIPLDEAKGIGL